jgi:sec-independent protein translocase protein TatB
VFNFGFSEMVVILVVAMLFLGPKLLPEIASGLGKIIREIRKATADIKQDFEVDEMIRGPLRELRDAATLPPEELKRRDEAKAARQKAEAEAAERRQREGQAADAAQGPPGAQAPAEAPATPKPTGPTDVISAGGTMIANPPPTDDLRAQTPLPELHSPPPVITAVQPPRLPVPPLPPPKPAPGAEPTVFDLNAQLTASAQATATATIAGRPVLDPKRPPPIKPPEGNKG